MDNTVLLDFKFSMFGDFSTVYRNIAQLASMPFYKRRIIEGAINNAPSNGASTPTYLFESDASLLRISTARIDICFKANNDLTDSVFIQTLDTFRTMLPNYLFRIAINYTFNIIDENFVHTRLMSKKFNVLLNDNYPNDFSISQVFKDKICLIPSNNIVNVQTATMVDRQTFVSKRAISCTFDINTVPNVDENSRQFLVRDNLMQLFKEAKLLLLNDLKSIGRLFQKTN